MNSRDKTSMDNVFTRYFCKYLQIEYKDLIKKVREDQTELKILIVEVVKALFLINSHNIVHSDLKT